MSAESSMIETDRRLRREDFSAPIALAPPRAHIGARLARALVALLVAAIIAQAFYVVEARPRRPDHRRPRHGRPAQPRHASRLVADTRHVVAGAGNRGLAIFGTVFGVLMALPLAVFAAANVTPARPLYFLARAVIALTRAVPDLVWALLFVTAVGLGPFPGALALSVHSIGMLGRLFAEVIEDMDFGPVEALTLTGASRLQVFTHAVVPGVLPSLLGISLYRFDENLRVPRSCSASSAPAASASNC